MVRSWTASRGDLRRCGTLDPGLGGLGDETAASGPDAPFVRGDRKVGRNEACPCGSGKKYKQCHGQLE